MNGLARYVVALFLVWCGFTCTPVTAAPRASAAASNLTSAEGSAHKFPVASKEEAEEAIKTYKLFAEAVGQKLNLHFATLETDHFLVFTTWDPREYAFLKENVEGAYTAVSRQFDVPRTDNVFVGKLPIFMFADKSDFLRFAKDIDHMADAERYAGFYRLNPNTGFHHMAMWKPDLVRAHGDVRLSEKDWAYTLTHEFTHAFIARYRTDVDIPRWLNEGTAEVIAYRQFPIRRVYSFIRILEGNGKGIRQIFEDKSMASFIEIDYHISQTVVETMIAGDPKAFLRFFNDVKDGVDPDEALKREYHTDRAGLERAWHKYVRTKATEQ